MVVFLILLFFGLRAKEIVATVFYDPKKPSFELEFGKYDCKNGLACAIFNKDIYDDGWDKINITTNVQGYPHSLPEETFAYAAGMLEGAMCWEEIFAIFTNHNNYWGWDKKPIPGNIYSFMQENLAYARQQVKVHPTTDLYWKHVGLILSQFDGMLEGYLSQSTKEKKLSEMNLFFLQSAGDLYGVLTKFGMSLEFAGLDCSGLIRLIPSPQNDGKFKDVFVGQDTWRSFGLQNKFFKIYNFDYKGVASETLAFSSSPGFISSKDDYYQTSAGLVVMETTNSVLNKDIISWVHPETIFTWIRSPLSSRLASSGDEWISLFQREYSATYTNQWMVLDWKKMSADGDLQDGFFYVLEEIPTLIMFQDMTLYLKTNLYWPSYNIPYFPLIYNMSGYLDEYGPSYYKDCPRAKMFKELYHNISDMDDFKIVMRYNKYQTDPYAKDDPSNGIMSRYDLRKNLTQAKAFGGIDSKLTSFSLRKGMSQWIQAGPTHETDQTPPFKWTEQFKDVSHIGQPELYNFEWLEYKCFQ